MEHSYMEQMNRISSPKTVVAKIVEDIRSQTKQAVLGMSGGADSTLCAVLCKKALGANNVHSLHMPYSEYDRSFFNHRSIYTAQHLGIHYYQVPIKEATDATVSVCEEVLGESLDQLNKGNVRARERMKVLYLFNHHLAQKHKQKSLVIGTGHMSEDFIGYDTKYGDSACDLFIIGELIKSEVYLLLDYYRNQGEITEEMIDRVPSAGLWEGQTDIEEIGFSYDDMAPYVISVHKEIYRKCDQCDSTFEKIDAKKDYASHIEEFVYKRHMQHRHKHLAPRVTPIF